MTWARKHGGAVYLTLLVLIVGAGSYTLSTAAVHRATRAAASVTQLCITGNEFRAQQVVLWEHLVAISKAPPHETVQARTQRLRTTRAFIAYVQRVFAPRNCQHQT